jgi:ElaB/YqjD/DUF883 family membrane-anchored ribosome-binding protein
MHAKNPTFWRRKREILRKPDMSQAQTPTPGLQIKARRSLRPRHVTCAQYVQARFRVLCGFRRFDMLDQVEAAVADKKGFFKGAIDAAEQAAEAGLKVERLKKAASHAIEDGMTDARRLVKRGKYAAEDLVEDTAHRIKKDPLTSVGVAFGAGFCLGTVLALLAAFKTRPAKYRDRRYAVKYRADKKRLKVPEEDQ